jgi:CubicO group peptidase (beta-lactamase class C family)
MMYKKNIYQPYRQTPIDYFLIKLMQQHNISVVGYAIIDKYKIIAGNTLSTCNNLIVNKSSLFQACSLSKPVTALGVLILQSQGKIDLDKPLNSQLTTWKIPTETFEPNIRQCLNMTSGLCYRELNPTFLPYTQDMPVPTLTDILNGQLPATNFSISLQSMPGSIYNYSGASYMVLQQLIEDVTNEPFSIFIEKNVLAPLGMIDSHFKQPLPAEHKKRAIPGFGANNQMLKNGWDNIPTLASGGLWSTPSDIANLILSISHGYLAKSSVISKNIALELLKFQKNTTFGLGVSLDGEKMSLNFRKNGKNRGYHNEFIMFPEVGQGAVIMTNSINGMSLIKDFIEFISREFNWQSFSLNFDEQIILQPLRCRL